MLAAAWLLEREARQAYLLRLKERLLNTALDDMSRHDPMTGLENRRALDLAFGAIARDAHHGEDIAVVLLDIDHFKPYNDTLGHMAGDEALRRVAQELRAGLRAGTDRAFRFGGEEFLLLLRRTSLSEAVQLAERLRRRIEAAELPHPHGPGAVVTASFGVAAARTGGEIGSDELVAGADAALYAAKRSGRNQVWPPFPVTRPEPVSAARETG
jgi:diguanylate cyclase (GGDEF)-like protein